jgi:hypothetical protein
MTDRLTRLPAITSIRRALRRRTKRTFTVTEGRGLCASWLFIAGPKGKQLDDGRSQAAIELGKLFGEPGGARGVILADDSEIARAIAALDSDLETPAAATSPT